MMISHSLLPARPAWRRACAFAFGLALAAGLHAQAPGRITGEVKDPQGQPLDGVRIVLRAAETGVEVTGETNKKGKFTMAVVDATKAYSITLSKEDYQSVTEPVDIPVGDALRGSWVLSPGAAGPEGGLTASPEPVERGGGLPPAAVKAYNEGVELLKANDLGAAAARFEEAAAAAPALAQAHQVLADIYVQQDRHDQALGHAEALLALDPANTAGLGLKVDALAGLGRRDEAEGALDALLAVDRTPDTAIRAFNSGVSALRANDLAKAAQRFEQALVASPDLKEAHSALGGLYIQMRRPQQAIAHGEALLAADPASARALLILYDGYSAAGDAAKAQEIFSRLQNADPATVVEAFFRQGQTLFDSGDTEGAIAAFEKVITTQPDHARGHYQLALCYASGGDMAKARQHLRKFLELAPNDPEAPVAREMLESLG